MPSRLPSVILVIAVLAAGCGGDDDDDVVVDADLPDGGSGSTADGPLGHDAGADAAPVDCPLAGGCPDWVEAYEREVVSALSGARPIAEGVTIEQRTTDEERDLVRTYLTGELARHGLTPELHAYGSGANVLAELPATRADAPLIVLGAHYDGVSGSPAAADDGTGVALVLAAARHLVGLERRDFTVIFALFDEEEVGLVGSQALAEKLRFEGVPIEAMHNFDMISWDEDGDRGIELWAPSPELEELYRAAAGDLGMPVESFPDFYSSDHAAFLAADQPAVGVGEEFHQGDSTPHYHQASDTYDTIDFGYLARATELALLVVERQLGAGL